MHPRLANPHFSRPARNGHSMRMANLEKPKGKCPCGEEIPEPLAFW
jgi:hypothetical protein